MKVEQKNESKDKICLFFWRQKFACYIELRDG